MTKVAMMNDTSAWINTRALYTLKARFFLNIQMLNSEYSLMILKILTQDLAFTK